MSDDSKPLSVPESSLSSAGKESATHSPQPVAGTAVQFPWLKHLLHDLQRQCCGRSVHIDPRNGPLIRKELEALLKLIADSESLLRDQALLDQLQKLYGALVPGGDYREHISKIAYNL